PHRDVSDRDAGLGGDTLTRGQFDGGAGVRLGHLVDLGDGDDPVVVLESDVDLEALAGHRTQYSMRTEAALRTGGEAASSVLGTHLLCLPKRLGRRKRYDSAGLNSKSQVKAGMRGLV